jgi:hypothetical protein
MFEYSQLKKKLTEMINTTKENSIRKQTLLEVNKIINDLEEEEIQEHLTWAEKNGYTEAVEPRSS